MKTCENCKTPLPPAGPKTQRFCDARCRAAHHRQQQARQLKAISTKALTWETSEWAKGHFRACREQAILLVMVTLDIPRSRAEELERGSRD